MNDGHRLRLMKSRNPSAGGTIRMRVPSTAPSTCGTLVLVSKRCAICIASLTFVMLMNRCKSFAITLQKLQAMYMQYVSLSIMYNYLIKCNTNLYRHRQTVVLWTENTSSTTRYSAHDARVSTAMATVFSNAIGCHTTMSFGCMSSFTISHNAWKVCFVIRKF